MSSWESIETTVVAALAEVQWQHQALLKSARAESWHDRKDLIQAILREPMPAVIVAVTGRGGPDRESLSAGAAKITVLLAVRSLRSDDEARRGNAELPGVMNAAQAVAVWLDGLDTSEDYRLRLIDEQSLGVQDHAALWEQRYELEPANATELVRFDGELLVGANSRIAVEVGALEQAAASFAFPGIDGVLTRLHGTRGRSIRWSGQLRALDDLGMNAIEAGIEDAVRRGRLGDVSDAWGRVFPSCRLRRFVRRGQRRRDAVSGDVVQGFEIEFEQLGESIE